MTLPRGVTGSVIGIGLVVFAVGCGSNAESPQQAVDSAPPASTAPTESSSTGVDAAADLPQSPDEAVTSYYNALGRHDADEARGLLAPEIREFQESSPDSDFKNVVSLDNIHTVGQRTDPPLSSALPSGYQDITLVTVEYDVVYKEVITDVSGPTVRFVYVGRASATEPWLIVSIGTGP